MRAYRQEDRTHGRVEVVTGGMFSGVDRLDAATQVVGFEPLAVPEEVA